MNPKKFGSLADTKNKPWKLPLPQYIESLYEERFEKQEPDVVLTMEQMAAEHIARREAKKGAKEADADPAKHLSATVPSTPETP